MMTTRVLTTTLPLQSAGCHNNKARFMRPLSAALETHSKHGHMQEPDPSCQGFVLTVAPSFVSIPGDVISVNSVSCGISIIRPRLLKQMPPSQGSISFSHLIIRIESGFQDQFPGHRVIVTRPIHEQGPQFLNQSSLSTSWGTKVVKESWLFCGNEGFVSVFQIFTDAVSLGEIYSLRQDE